MTSDELIDVWAYTEDYQVIIVEGVDDEPLYGLQNRHTYVIEVQEPVFSNIINYLIKIQDAYDVVKTLMNEDGSLRIDDIQPITLIKKEVIH